MICGPKISIITPTFNCEELIEDCIENVFEQTYTNIEHIIMDGASTDDTILRAKQMALKHNHIRIFSSKDKGIYDAMNKGISNSTGEWIYFLGADDRFVDFKVLEDLFVAGTQTDDVIYGSVQFEHSGLVYDGRFDLEKFMKKNICHQSIFIKKTVFERLGGFDLKYPLQADYAHNISWFTSKKFKKKFIDRTIAIYNEKGLSGMRNDFEFERDKTDLFQKNISAFRKLGLRLNRIFR